MASPPGRILSVVAEVEEMSPLATPTRNKGAESVQREESTQSVESEGDEDTLPLI